jgi:hypothetical protein
MSTSISTRGVVCPEAAPATSLSTWGVICYLFGTVAFDFEAVPFEQTCIYNKEQFILGALDRRETFIYNKEQPILGLFGRREALLSSSVKTPRLYNKKC